MIDNNTRPCKKSYARIFWIGLLIIILLGVIVFIAERYVNLSLSNDNNFYQGSYVNGYDVSNMSKEDAANYVSAKMLENRDDIVINLSYGDKKWTWLGKDFEVNSDLVNVIVESSKFKTSGNTFQKLSTIKKIKEEGFNVDVSYKYILCGIEDKIDNLAQEINSEPIEPVVEFNTKSDKNSFMVTEGKDGIKLDTLKLLDEIDTNLNNSTKIEIELPVEITSPEYTKNEIEKNITLRAKFSTSYASSSFDRKSNIKTALSNFNGKKVEVGEEVSFNNTTGTRSEANGYKKAHVILNGIYVEGTGGGVCQASTTLYNALIRADIDVLEVNKHSLPSSYVPLAFDAMVAENVSDLRFVNNLNYPIFIKAWGDDTNAYVEIYGEPYSSGTSLQPRAEFIKTIPHPGDRIVKDTNGEYADKVLYKGEYYRVKYPREGYESKAYMDYYVSGKLVESKLLRDEIYSPQEGIIVEGTEELGEGMTLPASEVKFIPPQKQNNLTEAEVAKKIKDTVKPEYNP